DNVDTLRQQGLNVIRGNAEDLRFEKGQHNAIVLTNVINHVSDPRKVLASVKRGLASENSFVLVIYCPMKSQESGHMNRPFEHTFFFSRENLQALMQELHYDLDTTENEQFKRWDLPMVVARRGPVSSPVQERILPGLDWGFYVTEIPESMVGGIGDVSQGLPESVLASETLNGRPHSVYRVTPYYKDMLAMITDIPLEDQPWLAHVSIPYQNSEIHVDVRVRQNADGIRDYLLVGEEFVYPYAKSDIHWPESALREAVAFNAVSAMLMLMGETRGDVLFLADWQMGLMLAYLREAEDLDYALLRQVRVRTADREYRGADLVEAFKARGGLERIAPIAWINNEAYRGQFTINNRDDFAWKTGLVSQEMYEYARWITPERPWDQQMILLKLMVEMTRREHGRVITVSDTYAQEVMGYNLRPGDYPGLLFAVLRDIGVTGILNGAPEEWRYITKPEEKVVAKLRLQEELSLERGEDKVIAFLMSRLVAQKGISLFIEGKEEIKRLMRYNSSLQFILGGQMDERWRWDLEGLKRELQHEFPGRTWMRFEFIPAKTLGRRIFEGADINLFPSLYEPAGTLSKGAMNMLLTVARLTGGLKESAVPLAGDFGNAVVFEEYSVRAFLAAWREAVRVVQDKALWARIQRNMPQTVLTWKVQEKLYEREVRQVRRNKGLSNGSVSSPLQRTETGITSSGKIRKDLLLMAAVDTTTERVKEQGTQTVVAVRKGETGTAVTTIRSVREEGYESAQGAGAADQFGYTGTTIVRVLPEGEEASSPVMNTDKSTERVKEQGTQTVVAVRKGETGTAVTTGRSAKEERHESAQERGMVLPARSLFFRTSRFIYRPTVRFAPGVFLEKKEVVLRFVPVDDKQDKTKTVYISLDEILTSGSFLESLLRLWQWFMALIHRLFRRYTAVEQALLAKMKTFKTGTRRGPGVTSTLRMIDPSLIAFVSTSQAPVGASTVMSSTPLSTEEYQDWKREQATESLSSPVGASTVMSSAPLSTEEYQDWKREQTMESLSSPVGATTVMSSTPVSRQEFLSYQNVMAGEEAPVSSPVGKIERKVEPAHPVVQTHNNRRPEPEVKKNEKKGAGAKQQRGDKVTISEEAWQLYEEAERKKKTGSQEEGVSSPVPESAKGPREWESE
ncbi:MAG TPA: glycogen/starch synthase, partial [Candidatus Omnitrophota bacterium]|nr:glycogen/starch synthase [Candidatus Omnitrophota bacterium]